MLASKRDILGFRIWALILFHGPNLPQAPANAVRQPAGGCQAAICLGVRQVKCQQAERVWTARLAPLSGRIRFTA